MTPASVLLRLAHMTANPDYERRAAATLQMMARPMAEQPVGFQGEQGAGEVGGGDLGGTVLGGVREGGLVQTAHHGPRSQPRRPPGPLRHRRAGRLDHQADIIGDGDQLEAGATSRLRISLYWGQPAAI